MLARPSWLNPAPGGPGKRIVAIEDREPVWLPSGNVLPGEVLAEVPVDGPGASRQAPRRGRELQPVM